MKPRVTISVLTYVALECAKKCIRSIQDNVSNYELILTSNGSPAAAAYFQSVAEANPRSVRVVVNETNEGFISPNRRALEMANGEYFLMCNDDCLFQPGLFAVMEQPFWLDSRCGLTAPAGGCRSLQIDFHGYLGDTIDYLEGACLMGRTAVLRKIGLFSDYLVGSYCEDADLSLRMVQAGYTLHEVTPPKPFEHLRGQTSNRVPGVHEMAARNRAVCVEKWGAYLRMKQNPRKILIQRRDAHGDVLLVSALVSAIKRALPGWPIGIESACPDCFIGNSEVAAFGSSLGWNDAIVVSLDMAYEDRPEMHVLDAYRIAAEAALGVPLNVERKTFIALDPHEVAVEGSVMGQGKWAAIHAGPVSWAGKSWPLSRWAALIEQMRLDDWQIVLVGLDDHDVLPHDKDRRGKTTVARLAAVLASVDLFIGLDSLPIHVAQAVGTPVVGLFGVTSAKYLLTDGSKWRAVQGEGLNAGARHKVSGLRHVESDGAEMASITVEQVLKSVRELTAL